MTKLAMFNQLKSLALSLDGLFKSTGQTNVKFHQVMAGVFLSVVKTIEASDEEVSREYSDHAYIANSIRITEDIEEQVTELMNYQKKERRLSVLRQIFGDNLNDVSEEELDSFCALMTDVVTGIMNAKDDRELNNVMNNYRYVDQANRFPSYITPEPNASVFKGRLVINHSYQKKETLEIGDTVNVVLTIDRQDATNLVRVVQAQLEGLGLVVGRLTSSTDTAERHVSFGLRMPYTEQLGALVKQLNEEVFPALTLQTAAKMQVVTPMDLRTSRSAISLIADESTQLLQGLQQQVHDAAGAKGNDLPRMHITHGNSPITAAAYDDILKFTDDTRVGLEHPLYADVEKYGLNLNDALKAKVNTELFASVFMTSDKFQPFPSCQMDVREKAEVMRMDLEESEKNDYRLNHFSLVLKLIASHENDWPTTYTLNKYTKLGYQRGLARFFALVAYKDKKDLFEMPRFIELLNNFSESAVSARDVAVLFDKKEFLLKLFEITPVEKRPEFIKESLRLATAMDNISMLELLRNTAKQHAIIYNVGKEKFERKRPQVHAGMFARVDHNKTTLPSAIEKIMSKKFGGEPKAYDQIDAAVEPNVYPLWRKPPTMASSQKDLTLGNVTEGVQDDSHATSSTSTMELK